MIAFSNPQKKFFSSSSLALFLRISWFVLCLVASSILCTQVYAKTSWFETDKAKHFSASAGITAASYGLGTLFLRTESSGLLFGAGLGLLAGITKESLDLAGWGEPSWSDMGWNVVGLMTGLLVAWCIHWFIHKWQMLRTNGIPQGLLPSFWYIQNAPNLKVNEFRKKKR